MLELEGLEVRYGAVPAVRGLSLRVAKGEIVGLIGPNGAGKSTTLHAIMALVPQPNVLMLDEPSLGLAPQLVDTVFEALESIRERGVTVLLVEQRAQRTVAFADRTYVLSNGALTTTLSPVDADDVDRMVAAYFGTH